MIQVKETNLVFIDETRPVTDSTTIAEAFEKGHDKVLRDIRSLKCSEKFRLANFGESSYKNKQGRIMPMYLVTQDGFAMLAMGYKGAKAIEFKERYINEFNRIRHILESREHEQKLLELQSDITLVSWEQKQIQNVIRHVILSRFLSISDKARRKYYVRLHSDLRMKFDVDSFRDIRRFQFEEALSFIKTWDSPNLASHKVSI
ncbi:Rha family transcriptional regulator [Bacillus solitudinis]|uniref:Rha family transcriptional regulator n=1 Tax=Bacillus solitudinis TaxID=2014074 RepID=UPI000C245E5F|nr:Rha family transcriptional regulator [Bacillus solitudinis]